MTHSEIPELDELDPIRDAATPAADVEAATEPDVPQEEEQPPARPWLWRDLDSQQQLELWTELGDFVDYIAHRYAGLPKDLRLGACWYRHPVAVEELTGLMVAHTYAYGIQDPSTLLVEFHERSLRPTLTRVHQILKGCVEGKAHQEPEQYIVPWSQYAPEFEAHILEEYARVQAAEKNAQEQV